MQGGQEKGETGKPVGRAPFVRCPCGAEQHSELGLRSLWGAGLFLPTCLIKMNTINHTQIMKHIQSRAEKMKYDQA
eukprot:3447440-Pyramimonas_sp.AAC.1